MMRFTMLRHAFALAAALVGGAVASAVAGPDSPDSSFGRDGRATSSLGRIASDVAADNRGRLLVATRAGRRGGELSFAVLRFLANGKPDGSFGNSGRVVIPHGGVGGVATAVVPDGGRVLAAGINGGELTVLRLLGDGSLDPGFATDGVVTQHIQGLGGRPDLAVDSQGRIVVAASANIGESLFYFLRFLPNGTPDSSFGDQGISRIDAAVDAAAFTAGVAVDPSDRIVFSGSKCDETGCTKVVGRVLINGDRDAFFFKGGITQAAAVDFTPGSAGDLALDDEGRILVSGQDASKGRMLVSRILPDGSLDSSFSGDGSALSAAGRAYDVALDQQGRIVVAGGSFGPASFRIVRLRPNGTPDRSFGRRGVVSTRFGRGPSGGRSVTLTPGSADIVAGGFAKKPGRRTVSRLALARYGRP